MKLKDYAFVAEILSAVAVVASLIFVGFQVQQQAEETALNTRAIQVGAYQVPLPPHRDFDVTANAPGFHATTAPGRAGGNLELGLSTTFDCGCSEGELSQMNSVQLTDGAPIGSSTGATLVSLTVIVFICALVWFASSSAAGKVV